VNIADILATVHLNLETGEFEANAAKAGDKAGATFGSKLKAAAGGAIGSAMGAAFGIALVGANQLDAATRQLQADTGMTAAEAKVAEGALAGMYRNNLQGFDQIGAAMAKVHNDLGLTGEAADKATESFLKFSTATGQDAAASVASFDDILDAWNLTAADAAGLMDGLIADHQKFGGVIAESQASLAAMAPAMQAANMSIDDGRALLNLFNAAGIDAAKAPAALAKAVKQLKPGQSLDDLIAQIGAIEDPTLRGQKAMELFGARSGIGMAQAIKPGMTSLDAFAISMGEATGKTDEAANAIESGFGNQFKLILKNAGGALAEFGTNFGPLLMVASAFGPKMLTSITSGLGGLAGLLGPRLIKLIAPKMAALGIAMGVSAATAEVAAQTTGVVAGQAAVGAAAAPAAGVAGGVIGTAMGVAAAAAIGLGIALAFKSIVLDPGLQAQTKQMGVDVGKQIQTGTTEALLTSKAALETGIARIKALPFGEMLYGDQLAALETQLDATTTEVERRATALGAAVPTALAAGAESTKPVWSGKVDEIVTFFGTSMGAVKLAAKQAGADGMLAMAAGISSARKAPLDAFDTLVTMLKTPLTRTAEAARIAGQLTSKSLAAGLRSKDPEIVAQATAVKEMLLARLAEITPASGKNGSAAAAAIAKGLKSKDPEIRQAALDAKGIVTKALNGTATPAAAAGTKAGAAYVHAFAGKVADDLGRAYVPRPGRDKTGGVNSYAVGTPYVPFDMTARIHQGEIIVPKMQSDEIRAGRSALGGAQTTVNVYNPTPEPASTSVSREMRKLAYMGAVS